MFSFFRKKKKNQVVGPLPTDFSFLGADMHSHLVAGVDDGAPDLSVSLELVQEMKAMGFKKIITTPHVFSDFYRNEKNVIQEGGQVLKEYLQLHKKEIDLEVAAEYYLDRYFVNEVLPQGLLTFGDKYVLVETSMAGAAADFDDCLFPVLAQGYKPVLAHIERYTYHSDVSYFQNLKAGGVLMQLNILSLIGYYGETIRHTAEKYLAANLYDFCGTDLHHHRQAALLRLMPQQHPHAFALLASYPHFKNQELVSGAS